MLVNDQVRREVASIVYPKVKFIAFSVPLFINFASSLTPLVKSTLRSLWVPIPTHHLQEKRQLSRALKDFPALQLLSLSRCNRTADKTSQGTSWQADTIHALKTMQEALPKLRYSYCIEPEKHREITLVDLASNPGETSGNYDTRVSNPIENVRFDISAEYESWLAANDRRGTLKIGRSDFVSQVDAMEH